MKSNQLLINKKGISFIVAYTALFVVCLTMLFMILNKFKLTTERATLFQATDSAARKVASSIYKNSYSSLEQNGEFQNNKDKNMQIAKEHLDSLGVLNGNLSLEDVTFNSKQAKVIVTCKYNYNSDYIYFRKGISKESYNRKLTIKGVSYLKSVEYKE